MTPVLEVVRVENKILLVGRFPLVSVGRDAMDDLMEYMKGFTNATPLVSDAILTCADATQHEGFVAFRIADDVVEAVPLVIDKLSRELMQMVNLTPCNCCKQRPLPNFSI